MFPIKTISFMEDYIKCGVLSTIYLYFTQKKCPPYKKNYVCQSCKVVSKHKSKFANITDLISVSTSGEQDKQKNKALVYAEESRHERMCYALSYSVMD
jgi:hypothetical protein